MKAIMFIFLLLAVLQVSGQKKKKQDPKDVTIDTLTRANQMLSKQVDSLSKDRVIYYGLYTTIKEKVLLKDFDPAQLPQIIDSIRESRDSTTSLLAAPVASLKDSLSIMVKENSILKSQVDTLNLAVQTYAVNNADKTKLAAELKDLKGLLDAKLINQSEYDAKKKLVMDKWK